MDRPLGASNQHQNGRSLIDRVGPHSRRGGGAGSGHLSPAQVSHIQAKIDGITGNPGARHPMNGRGQVPMPVNAGPPAMNISLQEMMVMNWDMMRQMANTIGMMAPPGPVGNFGYPQPHVGGIPPQQQMGGFQPGAPSFIPGPHGRGGINRGGAPGQGGMGGRGLGASPDQFVVPTQPEPLPAPTAIPALPVAPPAPPAPPAPLVPLISGPERPGTPSLCKYSLKCTNPQCRFSHPSPVATVESGVVLSTEFCPNGKDCIDKHCTFGHVSPSLVNGTSFLDSSSFHPVERL